MREGGRCYPLAVSQSLEQDGPRWIQHSRLEPCAAPPQAGAIFQACSPPPHPPVMLDVVEAPLAVRFDHPGGPPALERAGQPVNGGQCFHLRPAPIAPAPAILLLAGLPSPRHGAWPPRLLAGGDASRAPLAIPLRDGPPSDALGTESLPLESLHAVVHVLIEMARFVLRPDALPPRGCRLAAVPPAPFAKRLVEPLIDPQHAG
jgi:hypothetical protein